MKKRFLCVGTILLVMMFFTASTAMATLINADSNITGWSGAFLGNPAGTASANVTNSLLETNTTQSAGSGATTTATVSWAQAMGTFSGASRTASGSLDIDLTSAPAGSTASGQGTAWFGYFATLAPFTVSFNVTANVIGDVDGYVGIFVEAFDNYSSYTDLAVNDTPYAHSNVLDDNFDMVYGPNPNNPSNSGWFFAYTLAQISAIGGNDTLTAYFDFIGPTGAPAVVNMAAFAGGNTTTAPVPEPATMLLFGLGLMGLAGVRRKIKK